MRFAVGWQVGWLQVLLADLVALLLGLETPISEH
jgi:hypothetical protein